MQRAISTATSSVLICSQTPLRGRLARRASAGRSRASGLRLPSAGAAHESPSLSAARNASCGISTEPTRFMRRLPSFCFSSSLRLRLMSPP